MQTITRASIEEAIDDLAYQVDNITIDNTLRDDYSGRGMYGEQCFGVVLHDAREFALFILCVGQVDHTLAQSLARKVRTDNMGYDMIYYFPGVQLEE